MRVNSEGKGSDVVSKYLGKYIAKEDDRLIKDLPGGPGRMWGKWNIEDPEPVKVELYAQEAKMLATLLLPPMEAPGWHPLSDECFTVFGPKMGTDQLKTEVMWKIEMLLKHTRKWEQVSRTLDT